MNAGGIFLLGFILLVTVIGLATIQDFVTEEIPSANVEESSTETSKITVNISDGIGSGDNR